MVSNELAGLYGPGGIVLLALYESDNQWFELCRAFRIPF